MPCQSYQIKFGFVSGRFDIKQPRLVKKFEIGHNLSHGCGGSLFELGQFSMTPLWPNQSIKPSHHSFSVKFQILDWFGFLYVQMIRKKILTCKLLPGFRIIKTESDMHRHFSEKGHFWKWFWSFWSQMMSNK